MRSRYYLMEPEGAWESTLMEIQGEAEKRLDISNDSNKMESVRMTAARNGLDSDGGNEMTATAVA